MNSVSPVSSHPAHPHSFQAAFDRVRSRIEAIPEHELWTINLDIGSAVTTMLGRQPQLQLLRGEIITHAPTFDIERFDALCDHGLAMLHAHVQWQNANKPQSPIQDLGNAAVEKRDVMLADCMALANRKLLPRERVLEFKPAVGYRPTAELILAMVDLLRSHWEQVNSKTAITVEELAECETLAFDLLNAVGLRDGALPSVAEATLTRHRAYTAFMRAYDDARRVVIFLRWAQGDADNFAPSLYAGRSNGRKKPDEETPATSQPAPVAPATTQANAAPPAQAAAPAEPTNGPSTNPFA